MRKISALALAGALSLSAVSASAGTIVLEGSDAVSLHHDATYTTQLFSYLKSDSYNATLPVFILGFNPGGVPADTVASTILPATLFGVYSAVYVQSPGGCCSERPVSDADQLALKAFTDAGGSLAIQDYTGGLATALGFDAPQNEIGGWDVPGGGVGGGPTCWDTEIFLPGALAKGFTQPPVLGCWTHQAYDMDYFGAVLGFTSLVDSGRQWDDLGSGVWSSFLAKGGELGSTTTTDTVPEPATMGLLGLGLAGVAAARRRRKA